jgi:pimeloyl-ACP methyl ester carboxylesterase
LLGVAETLPPVPSALSGAVGRPFWNEARAGAERARLARSPVALAPGDGRNVVLVTGYLAPPRSAETLAGWLRGAGYRVRIADMARNLWSSSAAVERIATTLREHGPEPSALIGHSRGGQQCRVAAQRHPELVGNLITLGSPVRAHLPRQILLRTAVEATRLAARLPVGPSGDVAADADYERQLLGPYDVDVPWTAIWSKSDGVVEWQLCMDEAATSVEVDCSHTGLTASVPSFTAIAAALAR